MRMKSSSSSSSSLLSEESDDSHSTDTESSGGHDGAMEGRYTVVVDLRRPLGLKCGVCAVYLFAYLSDNRWNDMIIALL